MAGELATADTSKSDHGATEAPRRLRCLNHVCRVTAGAEGHQYIAPLRQRLDLAREHTLVAVVVAERGEERGVGGERDRRQRLALLAEAADELGGEVLRVGGAATVAAGEDLSTRAQALVHRGDGALEYRWQLECGAGGHGRVICKHLMYGHDSPIVHSCSRTPPVSGPAARIARASSCKSS